MKARVNGEEHELPEGTTVSQLLQRLHAENVGLAVAVNDRVVRSSSHTTTVLADGDAVEIIRAVAGG